MSIAKTTRPHLLTREAAAARIEVLEAALREIAAEEWGLYKEQADRIEALEAALRDIADDVRDDGKPSWTAKIARAALEGQDK